MDIDGTLAIADVEYFFRLRFGETVYSLALVSMFTPPDEELLEQSHRAIYICHHGGLDALRVVDIKSITAVVSMVPDYQVTVGGDILIPDNTFSLVEAPFLKLTALCGTLEDDDNGIDDANDTVE